MAEYHAQSKANKLALKVCLLYCFVAGLWIIVSDRVLAALVANIQLIAALQTYKGLAFIAVSASMLYVVLVRIFRKNELAVAKQAQAEQNARESCDRLKRILNGIFAFVGVLTPDGILLEGNYASFGAGKIKPEDVIGKPFPETYWWSHSAETQRELRECLKRAAQGEIVRRDFEVRAANDQRMTIDFIVSPLRNADNQIVELVASAVDITARKQAEDELRETSARFHQLAENITDVFWIRSPDFRKVIYVSPAFEKIWRRPVEELYSRPDKWTDYIFSEDRERVTTAFKELQKDAPALDTEYRIVWPNGELRWIRARGFQIRDAAGQVIRYAGIITDVTERRKLEEQIRQAQKMDAIGQLAGGVAHDFNNILAVIQIQAGLLAGSSEIPRQQQELAGDIIRAAERAANLTRQLLLFSRRQAVQAREHDLNEIVANMAKMLQRVLGEDIYMQFKWATEQLWICVDAGMMDQIVMNLAVNARDSMPKGGTLTIETSAVRFDKRSAANIPRARAGSFVCLKVSDTGCGISPENLPRIFEPFFTTKEVGKGTGLGLATVFGIVEQHQGWINVESEAGHGTTFRIYFPRLDKPSATNSRQAALSSMRSGNETILLVEDDSAVSTSVQSILAHLGYHVLGASNGVEALRLWKQHRLQIQLLLTDLVMPHGMSGRELAAKLLAEEPELKVIYTSGYATDFMNADFQLQDGVNFLQKPYSPQRLSEILRSNLD
ncbi:MAG TPA: ATP-binding protein [Verrucomicrobiae bacterium]|nr:ATP-binding protein [Verrucomicrobiae bacterium]